jgi:hypothetical protein
MCMTRILRGAGILRDAALGANDGIVSTASLLVGVAAVFLRHSVRVRSKRRFHLPPALLSAPRCHWLSTLGHPVRI